MKKKEVSVQRIIAIVFSIVNGCLLMLSLIPLSFWTLFTFGGKSWEYLYARFFRLLETNEGISRLCWLAAPYMIVFLGSLLLVGCIAYAAGLLKPKFGPVLWIATIIYNLPYPFFIIYWAWQTLKQEMSVESLIIPLLPAFWMILSCVFSGIACRLDFVEKRNNSLKELR